MKKIFEPFYIINLGFLFYFWINLSVRIGLIIMLIGLLLRLALLD